MTTYFPAWLYHQLLAEGEFGESRREPISRFGVESEFVVAVAEVLYERAQRTDHPC